MIALDTNILVYAHRADSPFHDPASAAMTALSEGPRLWAIPWPCIHEFFAVVTHPRIYKPPTPTDAALEQIGGWMDLPTLRLLGETETHWTTLSSLVLAGHIAGPQVHDARIAALCLAHGVDELWSADRDFSRFPALRIVNPLISTSKPG